VGAKVRGVRRVRVRFVSQEEGVGRKFDEFITDTSSETEDPERKLGEDSAEKEAHGRDGKHRH
jgi:hypothetical protein